MAQDDKRLCLSCSISQEPCIMIFIYGRYFEKDVITVSEKYITAAWSDKGTQIWVFLCNVKTQEPFWETKIWHRACLRNI